jgi:hypothetical protein
VVIQVYPPVAVIFTGIGVLLSVSAFSLNLLRTYCDAQISQAAKVVSAGQHALISIFERIESFFRRLETYIEVPPTSGMTDMIVKLLVEVLSMLSIATKEIKQSRTSEQIFGGMDCPFDSMIV